MKWRSQAGNAPFLLMAMQAVFGAWLCIQTQPSRAASGFTGTFQQSDWQVIRTNITNPTTPNPEVFSGDDPGINCDLGNLANASACIHRTGDDGVDIYGYYGMNADYYMTLRMRNTNERATAINFNWSFDTTEEGQEASIYLQYGSISIDSQTPGYSYQTQANFTSRSATAYLVPYGGYIDFTVFVPSGVDGAKIGISQFDYVQLPAPLPLAGSAAAFSCSRRLRRRQRRATRALSQPLASQGDVNTAARQRRQQLQAIQHYGALIGRPPVISPDLNRQLCAASAPSSFPSTATESGESGAA